MTTNAGPGIDGASPFAAILGQEPAVQTLVRAVRTGRVPHAYRFEGPDGVGKELAAFALAQALLCTARPLGCGECSACRRVATLAEGEPQVPQHPDVVLVQRGLYPKELLGGTSQEAMTISVHQIRRVVLGRAGFGPHEGRALVFIVRDADELGVQAANALLKTLEEPPARTHFILLTSRPTKLLDTIRSRTLAVRFGPLPESVIAGILQTEGHSPAAARLGDGSAARALALSVPEVLEAREEFSRGILQATASPTLVLAMELAAGNRDRRDLLADLHHLAHRLADRARALAPEAPAEAELHARRYAVVMETIADVGANAHPTLAVEALVLRLRAA